MKHRTIAQLEAQIAELRAEIEKLKAELKVEYHSHFHAAPLIPTLFIPQLLIPQPIAPSIPCWPQTPFSIGNQNAETNRVQMLC
jgi:hypothetical protein